MTFLQRGSYEAEMKYAFRTVIDNSILYTFTSEILYTYNTNIELLKLPKYISIDFNIRGWTPSQGFFNELSNMIMGLKIKDFYNKSLSFHAPRLNSIAYWVGGNAIKVKFNRGMVYDTVNHKLLIALMLPVSDYAIKVPSSGQNTHVWINKDIYDIKHPAYRAIGRYIRKIKKHNEEHPTALRTFLVKDNETMQKLIVRRSPKFISISDMQNFEKDLFKDTIRLFHIAKTYEKERRNDYFSGVLQNLHNVWSTL